MAELAPQERLQPFLLDRLRDDQPTEKNESRERRVFNMQKFRDAVLRDLSWLLNAKMHREEDGLDQYPLVYHSVINFGLPDITGSTASSISASRLEQMVRDAIYAFEPRIIRNTLSIKSVEAGKLQGLNVMALEIKAQIWALPMPESLFVKTEVDLESGTCELRDQLR